jgi:hypothetical protein
MHVPNSFYIATKSIWCSNMYCSLHFPLQAQRRMRLAATLNTLGTLLHLLLQANPQLCRTCSAQCRIYSAYASIARLPRNSAECVRLNVECIRHMPPLLHTPNSAECVRLNVECIRHMPPLHTPQLRRMRSAAMSNAFGISHLLL